MIMFGSFVSNVTGLSLKMGVRSDTGFALFYFMGKFSMWGTKNTECFSEGCGSQSALFYEYLFVE